MGKLQFHQDPQVKSRFAAYPEKPRKRLLYLKQLILEVASELEGVGEVVESLKWGEPSYSTPKGSPIRMNWKPRSPDHYALYFNCQTILIETFRILFADVLTFETKRAILFRMDDELPEKEVKACLKMALMYHQVKDKPMLGF